MSTDKNDNLKEEETTNAKATEAQVNTKNEATSEEPQKTKEAPSEVDRLKEELAQAKDKHIRLFAEFENYKRRTSKERIELFKTAGQEIMSVMLPVLDDFDRAINEIKKSEDADKSVLEGIELINSKLQETLNKQGLELMKVKAGDTFDADLHEAVTQIPAPKKKLKGKIIDVIEKGYTLGNKIIRYPKVVTGK